MSETFLSRWARRKEAVRSERTATPPALPPVDATETPLASDSASPPPAEAEAPLVELPSLEDLTAQSDLTAFLRAGVPTPLRNAALRRMWSLDPSIRDFVSEAREYAYDWNTPGGVPGLGPLLPTDDVKAMLDRVVNGVPAAEEANPEAVPEEAPSSDEPPTELGVAVASEATPPSDADAPPAVIDALPSDTLRAAPDSPETASLQGAPPPPDRPRLRRHGGAMPV